MGLFPTRLSAAERVRKFIRPLFSAGLKASSDVAAKMSPFAGSDGMILLPNDDPELVPPKRFWVNYAQDAEEYLATGKANMDAVVALLDRNGVQRPRAVMDLGCAAGRMIRHFPRDERSEIWGADISSQHIYWCQQNLPDINFVANDTSAHLPFGDGYFDFVMCASVFTHITDLADAWLLEIRRVLKPGGHAYISVHDKVSFEQLLAIYADDRSSPFGMLVKDFQKRHRPLESDLNMFSFGSDPNSQVFYDRDYLTAKWSRWMEVVAYEGQFHNYQSAVLLRKPGGA